MTEQNKREAELLDKLEESSNDSEVDMYSVATLNAYFEECKNVIVGLLKEREQYRAIGLTPELIEAMQGHNIAMINDLEAYQAIGTVEELQALKERLEQYEMAFDLLLKDDCKFAPQGWTGSIDDLYVGRKQYYFNKVNALRA